MWDYSIEVLKVAVCGMHCMDRNNRSEMEWRPFKCLFWNANDSIAKLMVSITNGISLWHRPCYKSML